MTVPVAAHICHDYQQGTRADTADSGGVPAQAFFLPRAALCGFLSVRLMTGLPSVGPGWQQGGSEWGPYWHLDQ
jgi:hypothetical protein